MKEWVTGRNPVYECLRANRRHFFRLLLAEGVKGRGKISPILDLANRRKLQPEWVRKTDLEGIDRNHQGVALQVSGYPYVHLDAILLRARNAGEPLFMLMLDQIQDPQNFGTLVRSAEVFGVHGILIPPRRAAAITPAVVTASSGASEHMLVVQGNLVQAMGRVKKSNGWVIGLDMDKEALPIDQVDWTGGLALVIGSEGSGLRRLVREKCDRIACIPMKGKLDSLNAAIAGSIALFTAFGQRNPQKTT